MESASNVCSCALMFGDKTASKIFNCLANILSLRPPLIVRPFEPNETRIDGTMPNEFIAQALFLFQNDK